MLKYPQLASKHYADLEFDVATNYLETAIQTNALKRYFVIIKNTRSI